MTSRFLRSCHSPKRRFISMATFSVQANRSEEHTSELQSQFHLVCRLLLEKKKAEIIPHDHGVLVHLSGVVLHERVAIADARVLNSVLPLVDATAAESHFVEVHFIDDPIME